MSSANKVVIKSMFSLKCFLPYQAVHGHIFRGRAAKPRPLSLVGRSGRTSQRESPDRLADDSQPPSQGQQFSEESALRVEPPSRGLPLFSPSPPFPRVLPPGFFPARDLSLPLHTAQSADTSPHLRFLILRHHPDSRDLARAARLDPAAWVLDLGGSRGLRCEHGCGCRVRDWGPPVLHYPCSRRTHGSPAVKKGRLPKSR